MYEQNIAELQKSVQALHAEAIHRKKVDHDLRDQLQTVVSRLDLSEQNADRRLGKIENDTGEILDIFHSLKGGVRVIGWLGAGAKWTGGLAGAWYAAYTFYLKLTGRQ